MLKHYVQRKNNPAHDSIPLSFSSDLLSSSNGDASSHGSTPSTVNVENEILLSSPLIPNSSIPMGERCIKCRETSHNRAKFAACQPLSLSSIQQQVIPESTITSTVDATCIKERSRIQCCF